MCTLIHPNKLMNVWGEDKKNNDTTEESKVPLKKNLGEKNGKGNVSTVVASKSVTFPKNILHEVL